MNPQHRPIILFLLAASLLLPACRLLQTITPTATSLPAILPPPTPTPADATPPALLSVIPEVVTVQNGGVLRIVVTAGEAGLSIEADVSLLDSTHAAPVRFLDQGNGNYLGTLTISHGNAAANGIKPIVVSAADPSGNLIRQTIEITLANPAPILDENPPNDSFDGAALDRSKWDFFIEHDGVVRLEAGRLVTTSDDREPFSRAMIQSTWKFTGNFDVQIDYELGEDWGRPKVNHLQSADLGVVVDEHYYSLTRVTNNISVPGDEYLAWKDAGSFLQRAPVNEPTGRLRLIRTGTSLVYLYDQGEGWKELGILSIPASPAMVYIGNASVEAYFSFTTYFDNFVINSGLTTR